MEIEVLHSIIYFIYISSFFGSSPSYDYSRNLKNYFSTNNNNSSAVSNHFSSTCHPLSIDIIIQVNNNMDFLIYESLLILRDRPILNSQMSPFPLTLFRMVVYIYLFLLFNCFLPLVYFN